MPPLVPVASSSIRAIGYDRHRRDLLVRYVSSPDLYRYFGVPPAVYRALAAAPSKGRFVNSRVKGRFAYRRERQSRR